MRVLHVIPSVAMRYGGPSVAIRALGEALAREGHEVTVATTDADGPGRLDVPLGAPIDLGGVRYLHFGRTLPGEWKFSWPLTRWLRANAASFDVIHVHAVFTYPSAVACRAALRAGVPYVVRPLGTLDPWSLTQGSWKKRPYLKFVEWPHLRGASAIHVTSEAEASAVRLLGLGGRARVIPLGVTLPAPSGEAARPDSGPLRLIFLSRLHPKKGIPLLLDALARAAARGADVELAIAGGGEAAYVDALRAHADRHGLTGRVRFLGALEGSAKTDALQSADAFVLPSSQENFGIAVAEAMLAGLPVLISDQVAIAPDVEAASAGRVLPLDGDAWASAIGSAAESRAALRQAGQRAAAFARERYSWPATARQLSALYAELAARREAPVAVPAASEEVVA